MANQLNKFDQLIKKTYEETNIPYDESVWQSIEEELDAVVPGPIDYFKSVTTGLVVTGVIFMSMLIFVSDGTLNPATTETVEDITIGESNPVMTEESETSSENFLLEEESEVIAENSSVSGVEKDTQKAVSKSQKIAEEDNVGAVKSETVVSKGKSDSEPAVDSIEEDSKGAVRMGCTGLTIDFEAPENYGAEAKYLWNFGDGYFSNEANPTHTFNKEGTFDVSLSVTNVGSGQISSNVVQAMIEVSEAPTADFILEVENAKEITLVNKSSINVPVSWEVNGESFMEESNVNLSLTDNTKYQVNLLAGEVGACIDTLEKTIHVIKAGNQFPQVYSPAHTTQFAPGAIVDNGSVIDFKVFRKDSGEEIYSSEGSKGWSGKNAEGKEVAKGGYTWVMVVETAESLDVYKGNVTLR